MQGMSLETDSSASIHESLRALRDSGLDNITIDILQLFVTKPMKVSTERIPPILCKCSMCFVVAFACQ